MNEQRGRRDHTELEKGRKRRERSVDTTERRDCSIDTIEPSFQQKEHQKEGNEFAFSL